MQRRAKIPWSGSGTYNLPPAYSPEVNGTTIDAARYNGLTGDVATGITACLAKNGENVPTANLPMGGFKHTGAGDASAAGQYVVFAQATAANIAGAWSAAALIPTGSTVPANGMYLPAANTVAWASNTTRRGSVNSTGNWTFLAPSSGLTAVFDARANSGVFIQGATNPALAIEEGVGSIFWISASTGELRIGGVGATAPSAGALDISNAGNLVVNAPSSGAALTLNQTSTAALLMSAGTGTASIYQRFDNTGGNYYFGAESSAGGVITTNSTAYAMVLNTESARPIQFGTNNTLQLSLESDGRLYGRSLHNNAGAVTGTTNQYIASGTYTPTLTSVSNVSATTSNGAQWTRTGNVVTVSGSLAIDPTSTNTFTEVGISLPIASNFTQTYHCAGTAVGALLTSNPVGAVAADTTNDRASLTFTIGADVTNNNWFFTFTYVIL